MFIERFARGRRGASSSSWDNKPAMALAPDFRTRPGARSAPAPHRGRHRPRHHAFAGGRGAQRRGRMPARRRGPRAAAVGGALPRQASAARSASTRWPRAPIDPANTITSVKRLMGRGLADIAQPRAAALPLRRASRHGARCRRVAGDKSPVEVSAEILATLRYRAEDTFDDELYGAVITVPAYFDEGQRQATKDAAQLAGLNVLRLISEPTAAAIAYGLDNAQRGRLRGLRPRRRHLRHLDPAADAGRVRGHRHRRRLGARRRRLRPRAGRSGAGAGRPRRPQSDGDKAALLIAARAAKEALSAPNRRRFAAEPSAGTPVRRRVRARAVRSGHREPHRTHHRGGAQGAARRASCKPDELQGVVLVGGATRMPQIRRAVAEFFGREPLTNLNPDEVVALGAAIQANQLAGNGGADDLLLLDVIPLSLGIETMGGLVERIVPRNQTIPTAMAQDFTTYQDGQTALALHVVQGERDLVRRLPQPGALRAARHPADGGRRGAHPRHLHGRCRRPAQRERAGAGQRRRGERRRQAVATACPTTRSPRMLQESFSTAEQDMQARALVEARVDAERMLLATQSALDADGDLLDADERAAIEALMAALRDARDGRRRSRRRGRHQGAGRRHRSLRRRAHERGHRARAVGPQDRIPLELQCPPSRSFPIPSTARRAPRSARPPAPRSARRCSRTTSTSSTPAR